MKRLFWWMVVLGLLPLAAPAAAPEQHDLGRGLVYVRVRALPGDLPAQPEGKVPACVLDLRYMSAEADGATALLAWLKFRATPRAPVFALVNRETAAAVREPLTRLERKGAVLIVGIPGGDFQPDVPVAATAEAERRAFDALDQGVELTRLLTDNPGKVRNDEASLNRDAPSDPAEGTARVPAAVAPETPPIDATLQRALHLHRALEALKKL
jgi:hypothetical protein